MHLVNNKRFQFLLNLLFWVLIAVVSATQLYIRFGDRYEGGWLNMFTRQLPLWLSWAALTPVILIIVKHISAKAWRRWKVFTIHVAIAIIISGTYSLLVAITTFTLYDGDTLLSDVWYANLLSQTASNLLVYLLIAIVGYALIWYENYKKSEIEKVELDFLNADLQRQLTNSQLQALQMQIKPHFLFNTLHSVASLIRSKDNSVAVEVIANLSDLLRYTLDETDNHLVPLSQEISFLRKYFTIEQLRFGERLKVSINITIEAEEKLVPNLILQPLVENALRHGFKNEDQVNELSIQGAVKNGRLIIAVDDNGIGIQAGKDNHQLSGIGLANTKERLATLFPGRYKFQLSNKDDGGVRVHISFPIVEDHNEPGKHGTENIHSHNS